MPNQNESVQEILQMPLAQLIYMLSSKGGGKMELEVEPVEKKKKSKLSSQRPMPRSRMTQREDDEEGSMQGCCGGFDDENHIGSSYT